MCDTYPITCVPHNLVRNRWEPALGRNMFLTAFPPRSEFYPLFHGHCLGLVKLPNVCPEALTPIRNFGSHVRKFSGKRGSRDTGTAP